MFQASHHTPEKQTARAHKRYQKARANGKSLAVDEIAKSGMSRSAWYRMKAKANTTPDIEQLIADAVTADYGTTPVVPEPTPEQDEEDFEYVYKRLNISPHTAYAWREAGKLVLKNGLWTIRERL